MKITQVEPILLGRSIFVRVHTDAGPVQRHPGDGVIGERLDVHRTAGHFPIPDWRTAAVQNHGVGARRAGGRRIEVPGEVVAAPRPSDMQHRKVVGQASDPVLPSSRCHDQRLILTQAHRRIRGVDPAERERDDVHSRLAVDGVVGVRHGEGRTEGGRTAHRGQRTRQVHHDRVVGHRGLGQSGRRRQHQAPAEEGRNADARRPSPLSASRRRRWGRCGSWGMHGTNRVDGRREG